MTPMGRSLELLRKMGYNCWCAEENLRFKREGEEDVVFKRDLFHFADIVALKPKKRLLVQTTSWSNISARIAKIESEPWFEWCRQAEFLIEVHGWNMLPPYDFKIIDLTAIDHDGRWVYEVSWDSLRSQKSLRLR